MCKLPSHCHSTKNNTMIQLIKSFIEVYTISFYNISSKHWVKQARFVTRSTTKTNSIVQNNFDYLSKTRRNYYSSLVDYYSDSLWLWTTLWIVFYLFFSLLIYWCSNGYLFIDYHVLQLPCPIINLNYFLSGSVEQIKND